MKYQFDIHDKQIKILYIAIGNIYGSDRSLLTLLDGLRGKICPYVAIEQNGGLEKLLEKRNIPHSKVNISSYNIRKIKSIRDVFLYLPRIFKTYLYNSTCFPTRLKPIIREFQPDIIHTNVGVYHIGYKLAKKMNIKHVWHLREYQDIDLNLKILNGKEKFIRLFERHNNYSIAITKGVADYFELSHGNVIYNGIKSANTSIFKPQKEKYFLYVGSIHEEKGVMILIKAFCQFILQNDKYKLYLIGKCSIAYKKQIDKIISYYPKAKNKIIFCGEKGKDDIEMFMSLASALIVPSYHEAFGRVVVEAMYNGCLVIGNNADGIKEQFDNGFDITGEEIGLRYNYRIEELIEKMYEIVNNGIEYYYSMILRSQQVVQKLYSSEEYCNKIYEVYRKMKDNSY
jgi:glycosyltransferase involved in cell wall biosynthesis